METAGWLLLNLVLTVASFYLLNLAHELGHLIAMNRVGLKCYKIFIGLPDDFRQPPQPTLSAFGVDLYLGRSSLLAFVRTNAYHLARLSPWRRIVGYLAGPVFGAAASIVWAITAHLLLHSNFQVIIGLIWVYLNLGTLWGGRGDGQEIRKALKEIIQR